MSREYIMTIFLAIVSIVITLSSYMWLKDIEQRYEAKYQKQQETIEILRLRVYEQGKILQKTLDKEKSL